MARPKKPAAVIVQDIRVTPRVKVTIEAPENEWPVIRWDGAFLSIDAAPANAPARQTARRDDDAEPISNTPTHDTPEILEMKRRLEERHAEAKKPMTSADAFAKAGIAVDASELEFSLLEGGLGV